MKEYNPWLDKWNLRQREFYLSMGKWKEFEGCEICINQLHCWSTMTWLLFPKRKCAIYNSGCFFDGGENAYKVSAEIKIS